MNLAGGMARLTSFFHVPLMVLGMFGAVSTVFTSFGALNHLNPNPLLIGLWMLITFPGLHFFGIAFGPFMSRHPLVGFVVWIGADVYLVCMAWEWVLFNTTELAGYLGMVYVLGIFLWLVGRRLKWVVNGFKS